MKIGNRDLSGASFRDPSGFLFSHDGNLYRQINRVYQQDYDFLLSSGLYEELVASKLLVSHHEVNLIPADRSLAYKIIKPELVSLISYPYEWSFSQLKDAALTTLLIQRVALGYGMSLKDASAYNIQFHQGRPILIDTLSFESHKEGEPWTAYRQFCQHFLAPLALMARKDVRLSQLFRIYIDGIPLDIASQLLPLSSKLNFGLLSHIHLHAQAQLRYAGKDVKSSRQRRRMRKETLKALVGHLETTVRKLQWAPAGTEWADYYNITNYSEAAFNHKKGLINEWVIRVSPASVWDLGANNGAFTRLASSRGIPSVAFDIDASAVEQDYCKVKHEKERNLLPLVLDLTNPSPALGWHNRERQSLLERGPVDMIFALALIHHLAISNNVPFERLADFFYEIGNWLVIEFVPKSDSQVIKLLANRTDIFDRYTQDEFERVFGELFTINEKIFIRESERCLYLMERKQHMR